MGRGWEAAPHTRDPSSSSQVECFLRHPERQRRIRLPCPFMCRLETGVTDSSACGLRMTGSKCGTVARRGRRAPQIKQSFVGAAGDQRSPLPHPHTCRLCRGGLRPPAVAMRDHIFVGCDIVLAKGAPGSSRPTHRRTAPHPRHSEAVRPKNPYFSSLGSLSEGAAAAGG